MFEIFSANIYWYAFRRKSLQVNLLYSGAVCDAAVVLGPVQGRHSLHLVFVLVFFNGDVFGSPGGIESSLKLRIKEKTKSCICLLDL